MNPPKAVTKLLAPFLTLLGRKIREQGFTELEVEEALGWGKSYIRQLMTGRKGLRVDQLLSILGVIGVEPKAFYAELYGMAPRIEGLRVELTELSLLVDSLTDLLVEKEMVTANELKRAVAARKGKPLLHEDS